MLSQSLSAALKEEKKHAAECTTKMSKRHLCHSCLRRDAPQHVSIGNIMSSYKAYAVV